ncbi:uncharacterized protein LOC129747629 isoform X3 [Uranotaenia lowii]|uniref:uncharacterized protein LOC129747629 isoform X3 n=1 Tax=Uranotaenia lowii TaxID=190385 RepID=UPI00247A27B3|nr:uncharacterized protein LOC129747629 isoform X3 [Uranotaenia lowii]
MIKHVRKYQLATLYTLLCVNGFSLVRWRSFFSLANVSEHSQSRAKSPQSRKPSYRTRTYGIVASVLLIQKRISQEGGPTREFMCALIVIRRAILKITAICVNVTTIHPGTIIPDSNQRLDLLILRNQNATFWQYPEKGQYICADLSGGLRPGSNTGELLDLELPRERRATWLAGLLAD